MKNEVKFEGRKHLTVKNGKDRKQLPVMIHIVKISHRCSDQIGLTHLALNCEHIKSQQSIYSQIEDKTK